jgi:hypothetical protein
MMLSIFYQLAIYFYFLQNQLLNHINKNAE